MARIFILLVLAAMALNACAPGPQAAAMAAGVPDVQTGHAAAKTISLVTAPAPAVLPTPSPTPVDYRTIWPLGRKFSDTATVEGKYSLDFGGGVKVSIENRSHSKITIDEPALYYYLAHLGPCPDLPKLVIVDGVRDAEIMQELGQPVLVVGSDRASLNIGLTDGCLIKDSGYPQQPLREISTQNWDQSVHTVAVLLGLTYDEYVALAKVHRAQAVACGTDECEGYKSIAADLFSAQVRHAPIQSQKP